MDNFSIKHYLLRGCTWAFAGKALTVFMGLLLSALLARLLSPKDMGAYFLAFNLATFFSIFGRMGLENTLLRFVTEALGANQFCYARIVIRKGLWLALVSTVTVAMLVYFGVGSWITQNFFKLNIVGGLEGFVAIWLVLLAFQVLFGEIFRAFQDIRMAVLFGGLFTSAVTVLFVSIGMFAEAQVTLNLLLVLVLVAGAFNILFAIWVLIIKLRALHFLGTKKTIEYSKLIRHSCPLLINAVMSFLMSQSSLWIVGGARPEAEIAIYGAAARLVLLTSTVLIVVNAVVPPLIARFHVQKDLKRLERILRAIATIAAVPSFVVLSVFILCGSWVLGNIFGDYYRSGGFVLMILSIGQVVNVLVGSCGYTLIMMGHGRTMMLISMTSAVIALWSSLVLIQSYGIVGVATGYAFAMIVQQLLMLVFARYQCGIWTHASLCYLYTSTFLIKKHLLKLFNET